jgi:uncharacterized membrane protein YhaH (DUF805 family)
MSLMFEPLRKYAQFSGRARRSEYWLFFLLIVIAEIVYFAVLGAAGGFSPNGPSGAAMAVMGIFSLAFLGVIIPGLAVSFRRLHDTDRSAWWLLISLIPGIGGLVLLVFYLLPGTNGPNKFGPDPKASPTGDTAAVFS